jgi:superfamily I DNA/RNA helicase
MERGHKVGISLLSDSVELTPEDVTKHGVKDLRNWRDSLEGSDYNTRQYYSTIMANGYKLAAYPNIKLSTIHAIKGGEADHVVLFSDMATKSFDEYIKDPDNERRVAYVGVTRAKQRLSIVNPFTRKFFDYRAESYE